LNLRPSGYEPDELPDCSTPRRTGIRGQRTEHRPRRAGLRLLDREASRDGQGPRSARVRQAARSARGRQPARARGLRLLPSVFCHLWTPGSTWRRPALPPLLGQYPGRGGVSRPSSEWGRVGPPRCDHQVEPEVQRTDGRWQMTPAPGSGSTGAWRAGQGRGCPGAWSWSREALEHGPADREQRAENRRLAAGAGCRATSSSDICYLSSALCSCVLGAGCGRGIRAIRTARLHGLPRFDLRPIDVVVDHGSQRDLVWRRVSRLDAFSGYPDRT
jgi:hypothetical protein